MNSKFKSRYISIFLAGLMTFILPTAANATWSIIVMDSETKEIGVAGASCSYMVFWVAGVVPGKGAVIAQAASNRVAKDTAVAMVREGKSPTEIIFFITDPEFNPTFAKSQYAIMDFQTLDSPQTFTGQETPLQGGALYAEGISVQGNTLANENVLKATLAAALEARDNKKPLSDILMAALDAGAKAGGDVRCGDQKATSSFMSIYKPDSGERTPFVSLVISGLDRGESSAVEHLWDLYRFWQSMPQKDLSTEIFIVPEN